MCGVGCIVCVLWCVVLYGVHVCGAVWVSCMYAYVMYVMCVRDVCGVCVGCGVGGGYVVAGVCVVGVCVVFVACDVCVKCGVCVL